MLMTAKKQFKELNKEIKFITKGDEHYRPIYLDVERGVLRVKPVKPPKTDKLDSRTKTYEEVSQKYTIEVVTEVVTPDMYYMDKIGKDGVYNSETIRNKRFVKYVTEHKEDCTHVYDRLREIALSNEKKTVKKAAYDVLTEIWGEDEEFNKAYQNSYLKEGGGAECYKKDIYIQKFTLTALETEKAIIVYMDLIRNETMNQNRTKITYGKFSDKWDKMFGLAKNANMRERKIQAFKDMRHLFDEMSLKEISEYRRANYMIFAGDEVPTELKQLARSRGIIVKLAENRDKHLSGFDLLRMKGKNDTPRLTPIPYGFSEEQATRFINNIPSIKERDVMEKELMKILSSDECTMENKKKAVRAYHSSTVSHEFEVFMNRFCLKQCKDKILLNDCVSLCKRTNILNLQNNKPIKYCFCKGSGKRKQTMNRVKRARNRRKGNAKKKR